MVVSSEQVGTVWRVSRGAARGVTVDRVEENLALVAELAAGGPVVAPQCCSVAHVNGIHMSAWPLGVAAACGDSRGLGWCLAGLHRQRPVGHVPAFGGFGRVRGWLSAARGYGCPDGLVRRLAQAADALAGRVRSVCADGQDLVHGAVTPWCVVVVGGQPRLVGLDAVSRGPWQVDFSSLWVQTHLLGHGTPDQFEAAVAGYGADPRSWSGFATMCQWYALVAVIEEAGSGVPPEWDEVAERLDRWVARDYWPGLPGRQQSAA